LKLSTEEAGHRVSRGVGKREGGGPKHGSEFWEITMKDKWMFVALGYVLVLAALGFAVDAGIAAMVVFSG
jgi:hypothetical protein